MDTLDILLNPFFDIVKYYVQIKYLTFDDNKLNLLLYTFMGSLITIISKLITNSEKFYNIIVYIKWIITYKILCIEKTYIGEGALYSNLYNKLGYHYSTTDLTKNYVVDFVNKDNFHIYGYLLYKYSIQYSLDLTKNSKDTYIKYITAYYDHNRVKETDKINLDLFCLVAYIDGYPVYLINRTYSFSLITVKDGKKGKSIMYKFTTMAMDTYNKDHENIKLDDSLYIYEYNSSNNSAKTNNTNIGIVKTGLTFDNYVSCHKKFILTKLDAFKENNLYPNNPYMNNNIGLLLHGTYGTGKTYLMSAIANYLKRDIMIINFAKITKKSQYRAMMSQENIKKYVYCFDEFDYLLSKLFEKNTNGDTILQYKLNLIVQQLKGCTDEKNRKDLTDEMRKMMEEGSSDELTYEFLLSELSGLTSVEGRVIIATTNFIDNIPPALKRPGRLDIILMLNRFNRDEMIELLNKMYKLSDNEKKRLNNTKLKEYTFTPADIIMKRCELDKFDRLLNYLKE